MVRPSKVYNVTGWRIEGAAKDLVGEDGMGLMEDRRSRVDARASNVAETAGGGGGKGHG